MPRLRRFPLVVACLGTLLLACMAGTADAKKPLKIDPNAERVGLFDGMDGGLLEARMVPKNSLGGTVVIKNVSDKPLTVEMPEAMVGVQVLKQFGPGAGGGIGGGGIGGGGGLGGGAGGGAQSVGGGIGGGGLGGGGLGGGGLGGGMFSIPPEKTAKIPYQSICLEHGKKEPSSRLSYHIIRPEQYTDNTGLIELVKIVGKNQVNLKAAQAAAWNIANGMTWQQLAAKSQVQGFSGPATPWFTQAELLGGQNLQALALGKAREAAEEKRKNDSVEVESASESQLPERLRARLGE